MAEQSHFATALAELGEVAEAIDHQQIDQACKLIVAARRIVLYGCGREGLQLRGLAMRLFHLGRNATMQGDMSTPPVASPDLLLCSAGPGELATVTALIGRAKNAGAKVLFLTAEPSCAAAKLADQVLVIPAQTMARDRKQGQSILPMGSVYEGALFLLFEIMVLKLRDTLGETAQTMRARHTNLE